MLNGIEGPRPADYKLAQREGGPVSHQYLYSAPLSGDKSPVPAGTKQAMFWHRIEDGGREWEKAQREEGIYSNNANRR